MCYTLNNNNNLCTKTITKHDEVMYSYEYFNQFPISRAPVAQSVATRAVNPGVVSSNPGSANFLSED